VIEKNMQSKIADAYISVDVQDGALSRLCHSLKEVLAESGIDCETASPCPHVSIAYGTGECSVEDLAEAVREIASQPFEVRATGFDILEGRQTQFDYLVLTLGSDGAFEQAVEVASEHMSCRRFKDENCTHISLLRFPKGSLNQKIAKDIVREMNASQAAAFALGRNVSLTGSRVNVFDPERRCCLTVSFSSVSREHVA
jgi:hypothetical protein